MPQGSHSLTGEEGQFDALILLDRETDTLTPLLTQLTYQGLIDHYFGINYSYVKLEMTFIEGKAENVGKTFDCPLDDEIFKDIKDANIKTLSKKLIKEMIDAKEVIKALRENKEMEDIAKLKMMSQKGKRLKAVELHLNISFELLKKMKAKTNSKCLTLEQVQTSYLGLSGGRRFKRAPTADTELDSF